MPPRTRRVPETGAVTTSAAHYAWIHDTVLAEAGCVTVVPAADREAVLIAFGAREATGREVASLEVASDEQVTAHGYYGPGWIYVVAIGDALLVLEENGFQGVRSEVLTRASTASRTGQAAAYFWNANALTELAVAVGGEKQVSVELLGAEEEDLVGLPAALRAVALEGAQVGSDRESAGIAVVAGTTGVPFSAASLVGGTVYEIDPLPEGLRTLGPGEDSMRSVTPVAPAVAVLPADVQRRLALWATTAAVREGDVGDEAVVRDVLAALSGGTAVTPTTLGRLDELARVTVRATDDFELIERAMEPSMEEVPPHTYYVATRPGPFGDSEALSHLEGSYLGQRRWAVETVRRATHLDPYSAAVECLGHASTVYSLGTTTRGWLFDEGEWGRRYVGFEPAPRHLQYDEVVTRLLSDLVELVTTTGADGMETATSPDADVWARATAALPAPLTPDERTRAIHADAEAALDGAFSTWQTDLTHDPFDGGFDSGHATWHMGWGAVADGPVDGIEDGVEDGLQSWSGDDHTVVVRASFLQENPSYGDTPDDHAARVTAELRAHEARLFAAEHPAEVLHRVAGLDVRAGLDALREAYGWDEAEARAVLALSFRATTREGLDHLRQQRHWSLQELEHWRDVAAAADDQPGRTDSGRTGPGHTDPGDADPSGPVPD